MVSEAFVLEVLGYLSSHYQPGRPTLPGVGELRSHLRGWHPQTTRRRYRRWDTALEGWLELDNTRAPFLVHNLSATGMRFRLLDDDEGWLGFDETIEVSLALPGPQLVATLPAHFVRFRTNSKTYGVRFCGPPKLHRQRQIPRSRLCFAV